MNQKLIILALVALASCTAAKVSVPDSFSGQSTRYSVKGINGWQTNQKLSFGQFNTSKVKRGWDFTSSVQYTKFSVRPEEFVLKVFDINIDRKNNNQRNKYQYTIDDGKLMTEIYATEKFNEKQLVYKSNDPILGSFSKTNSYEYSFSAAIVPINLKEKDAWSLVIMNRYDAKWDTAQKLFDRPYVEQEGYATNGKEKIMIRPLSIENMTTASGKKTKVFGGKMLSGYELRWDDGVVGIIDILDNSIWIYNDLEAEEKLILSSISSAILLKRMQDVEKDKDDFDLN